MSQNTDVAIIGAGPSGCIAALAFAQKGANVTLIEAHSEAKKKFAGEWLHPTAVEIMKSLNVPTIPATEQHPPKQGFVVFPHDGSGPVELDYADRRTGITCEHNKLVDALREVAITNSSVRYMPDTRFTHIDGQHLTLENTKHEQSTTLVAGTIVGASGRFSTIRKAPGLSNKCTLLSYMAGILLDDVEMPFEGRGHILLGGPGPILAYRLNAHQVHLCIDVPIDAYKGDRNRFLSEAYTSVIPDSWRDPLRQTIQRDDVVWAANQHRSREHYGRKGLTLIGDAAGFFHPLTAIGMTLGFQDGMSLSQSRDFEAFERHRHGHSHVPELLATSLYDFFMCKTPGAAMLCEGIYQMWRKDENERRRTMQILSGDKTDGADFVTPFLKVIGLTARQTLSEKRRWRHAPSVMGYIGRWLQWLASSARPFS